MSTQYTDEQKRIFGPYLNGVVEVYGDPLAIHRKLHIKCNGDINAVIKASQSKDDTAGQFEAAEKILEASIYAFGLTPFDPATGSGILTADIFKLFDHFIGWQNQKKTSGVPMPTSQPVMDSTYCRPVTRNGTASTSMSAESVASGQLLTDKVPS